MKKLLILGGQQKLCDIVNKAREMGIYTVVTDWYENSPAKLIADKSYDVSTSDVDAILQLIRQENIDGVVTGYIDSTLPYYYEICRRAGFPCYLNREILECCTNKRRFKDVCAEAGIKTIPEVNIEDAGSVEYPVLVKPVDNSGSKGITVCYDLDMTEKARERAMRFSKSKAVLTERFLQCDYIAAYYIVHDGDVRLHLLMDKDTNRIGRGIVPYPTAFVFPSRYEQDYIRNIHPLVVRLARRLKMENGMFQISFFVSGSNYYAVELTARLTATREYIFIKDMCDADPLEMYINHALTGSFACTESKSLAEISQQGLKPVVYCMLFVFLKEGVIGRIEGVESVTKMDELLDVLQLRYVGAKIRADGSYGQLFMRIHLRAESKAQMISVVNDIQKELQVFSEEGMPMIVTGFDAGKFF